MRILSKGDIKKILTMKQGIEIMRSVFSQITKNEITMPDRTLLNPWNNNNTMLFMPGYIPKSKGLGIKIISFFPENELKGIPTISGVIVLINPDTGEIISLMDAEYITSLRTGATSAVATDLLALKDVRTLGVIGAGIQAKSQIEAILEVRNIKKIKIYDLDFNKSIKLSEDMKKLKGDTCNFLAVNSSHEAIADSEIIVTATTSKSPVFDGSLLKNGTHINAIGSFKPHLRELDDQTITRSRIFVDSYSSCFKEAGDIVIPLEKGIISEKNIHGELGELILKRKKGRENNKEITLFKSVGLAIQDIAVARNVYQKAEKANSGLLYEQNFN